MRVLCIGLDPRVAEPDEAGYAARWARAMAARFREYVVIAESRNGQTAGPVQLAANASAYLVPGPPAVYPLNAARFAVALHTACPFDLVTTEDPIRAGLAGVLFKRRTGVALNVENHSFHINEPVWLRARLHHRIYNRIAIRVVRRADSIRNYSPDQAAALRDLGIPDGRLTAIPPPCPVMPAVSRREARARIGLTESDRVVVTAGRMVPYKNLGALLDAAAIVRRKGPLRLLLAGTGPSLPQWMAHADSLGLGEQVEWLGDVPSGEMPYLYASADAFVTTAIHETGPRTVMEALACGCPVISTRGTGVVRMGICVNGETGLVVRHDDPAGIAAAMAAMLAEPDRSRAWAAEGHKRMRDRYAMPAVAAAVADLYEATAACCASGSSEYLPPRAACRPLCEPHALRVAEPEGSAARR